MAVSLQRNGFPLVCVLDGGFPELVHHLQSTRGTVEPVIINHDPDRWQEFLRATGRSAKSSPVLPPVTTALASDTSNDKQATSDGSKGGAMEEAALAMVAMRVATRLGHLHMAAMLRKKLESLGVANIDFSEASSGTTM